MAKVFIREVIKHILLYIACSCQYRVSARRRRMGQLFRTA